MEYKVYQSKVIKDNHLDFIKNCQRAQTKFEKLFKSEDSTYNYTKYNFFSLTSTSILFYNLYKELNFYIRDYIGDDRPLWIQNWLNFHSSDKVLKKHLHNSRYHGYISIDPKNTTTVFNQFEIKNNIGQIYIGPGGEEYSHYVRIDSEFKDKRITIGFDIEDRQDIISPFLGLTPLI